MTIIDTNMDLLKTLHRQGLISHKVFFFNEVYKDFQEHRCKWKTKQDTVFFLADKHRVDPQTIYNALRRIEKL